MFRQEYVNSVFSFVQVFVANRDASSVVTFSLKPTVDTRLIRIVPSTWTGSLCMRIEFYGCPFGRRKWHVINSKYQAFIIKKQIIVSLLILLSAISQLSVATFSI